METAVFVCVFVCMCECMYVCMCVCKQIFVFFSTLMNDNKQQQQQQTYHRETKSIKSFEKFSSESFGDGPSTMLANSSKMGMMGPACCAAERPGNTGGSRISASVIKSVPMGIGKRPVASSIAETPENVIRYSNTQTPELATFAWS